MKSRLIEYLACPHCQSGLACEIHLEDRQFAWTEIWTGLLRCQSCGREYPIVDGVPRLFLAERLPEAVRNTIDGFGWEWQTFNYQIQDTYMTSQTHFLDFIHPITADFFSGKVVLDAGCGMGRFLKLGAEWGSQEIIGVDLSRSVEAAYRNTRHLPNAHVIQADIMALPLAIRFDYIFSVGVVMCLHNPKEGFTALSQLLRPGGTISVWVYAQENNWVVARVLTPFRELITSRLPRRVLYWLSYVLALPLFALTRTVYKPVNERPKLRGLRRLLPYNDYLYYSSRLSLPSLASVVFDHLVPQLVEYISRAELESWFQDGNLTKISITPRNNMSWRGHGRRPREGEAMLAPAEVETR